MGEIIFKFLSLFYLFMLYYLGSVLYINYYYMQTFWILNQGIFYRKELLTKFVVFLILFYKLY